MLTRATIALALSVCFHSTCQGFFTIPFDGTLTFELTSTHAGTSVQELGFGTPAVSSTLEERDVIFSATFENDTLADVYPASFVDAGFFTRRTQLEFYQRSTFLGLKYGYTSRLKTAPIFEDLEAFTDRNDSLDLNGRIIEKIASNQWMMYLDSAGSFDDDDNDLVIRMTLSAPGDFNSDGTVDAADYAAWRNGFATGDYNQQDYLDWRAHYGASASGVASSGVAAGNGALAPVSAPAPAGSALLFVACAALRLRRRDYRLCYHSLLARTGSNQPTCQCGSTRRAVQ